MCIARVIMIHVCGAVMLLIAGHVGVQQIEARTMDQPCRELPPAIRVSGSLRRVVAELLRRSPTFARQCAVIAAHRRVRVTIVTVPPSELASAARARAAIHHFEHGLITARIEVPAAAHFPELLPHELEHVIEQIEGVKLAELSAAGHPGVLEVEKGVFETVRAQQAGRAAAAEFSGAAESGIATAARGVARTLRAIGLRAPSAAEQRMSGGR